MKTSDVWKSGELAATYLSEVRGAIPLAAEQIDVALRIIAASASGAPSFLDLGCGSGILGASILERFPNAQGVFLDLSDAMLDAARENLSFQRERVRFARCDLTEPTWTDAARDDAPFDAVVSGFAIHHLTHERKRVLYAEIHSLLTPGGVFVNVEHVDSATEWVRERFDQLFIDSLYAHHRAQGGDRNRDDLAAEFYYRPDKQANILASVEDQCDWLREIGYEDVDCYFKLFELAVFGGRRALCQDERR